MNDMRRIWLVAIGYWIVVSTLICLCYPLMVFDSISRYAPMAESFAAGEWRFAFHPRFGVIFPPLTGSLVWLFGIGGDMACQLVSTALLALSAVPVWLIARRIFNDCRIAWVATILLLVATEYLTYAADGLRDTGRTLGLALCALALLNGHSWVMALGIFVLSVIKVDLYAFSCALLAFWCGIALWHKQWKRLVLPILAWLVGTLAMCTMTYFETGYFLPLAQFVKLYLKLTGGTL